MFSLAKVRGIILFLGMVLAAMLFWGFVIRNFAAHHPDNPAAQALATLL